MGLGERALSAGKGSFVRKLYVRKGPLPLQILSKRATGNEIAGKVQAESRQVSWKLGTSTVLKFKVIVCQ